MNSYSDNKDRNNIAHTNDAVDPIAIVGIGCRFPGGVTNTKEYWELLLNGVDAISMVPEDRWNLNSFANDDRSAPGKTYTRHGGFIDGISQFDPAFFNISPREAASMDPQQRLLLETSWEAMADAGLDTQKLRRAHVGVYMGIFTHDYNNLQLDSLNRELIDTHTGVGGSMSIVANRISYTFDLIGPSLTLDTACSSSLVALHLACQAIRNGEIDMAVVGGANACLKPEFTIATSKAGMLSPDGRCKSFDNSANGYVRSEGMGVVVLKSLKQAQKDGDQIYSVISSNVSNQDGKSDGLTVPNSDSQKIAIRRALKLANLKPHQISYAEAHGTGTFVGDPIEANSIGSVLNSGRDKELLIGSVKSNIGHLEAASGMAGLIKTSLALKHKMIPPNVHFNNPNPKIEFDKYNMRVPTSVEAWTTENGEPRYACLNSFGFGGSNATVILTEAPEPTSKSVTGIEKTYMLPLSAANPTALRDVAERMGAYLKDVDSSLDDICYSAAQRSSHLKYRIVLVGSDKENFISLIDQYLDNKKSPYIIEGENKYIDGKLAFVFSGMGSQWWAMGRQLLESNPLFYKTIETCDKLLSEYVSWSLLEELGRKEEDSLVNRTDIAQPAIFAVEIALANVWQEMGIKADYICGHSVGEVAAAYTSGALTLEDAIKVIYHRSRLQHKTAGLGGMLAVGLSPEAIAEKVEKFSEKVSIAAVNSPSSVTLSGEMDALNEIKTELDNAKVFCRLLKVEVPYHCVVMDKIKDELLTSLESLKPQKTHTPLYSTVTGKLIDGELLNAEYWWNNVRETVVFADTISAMHAAGEENADEKIDIYLEVGPHPVLNQSIKETLDGKSSALVLGTVKRLHDEQVSILSSCAALHTFGFPIQWSAIKNANYVRLPSYPWQHQSYWHESDVSREYRTGQMGIKSKLQSSEHPLLGVKLNLSHKDKIWEADLHSNMVPYLPNHQVNETIVFPGAGFIEMALSASAKPGQNVTALHNVSFEKILMLSDQTLGMQCVLTDDSFTIATHSDDGDNVDDWKMHARGHIGYAENHTDSEVSTLDLPALQSRLTKEMDHPDVYALFNSMGFGYQGDFSGIQKVHLGDAEALAQIHLAQVPDDVYKMYPPLLDNAFQAILCAAAGNDENDVDQVFLPIQIDSIAVHHGPAQKISDKELEFWCHSHITEYNERGTKGNLSLYNSKGTLMIEIVGLYCLAVSSEKWLQMLALENQKSASPWFYEVEWKPEEVLAVEPVTTPRTWLVFADQKNTSLEAAQRLKESGDRVVLISAANDGSNFKQVNNDEFIIAANEPDDYDRLLEAVSSVDNMAGIISFWPMDLPEVNKLKDISCGCGDLLLLLQAVNRTGWEVPVSLVTRGSQNVDSELVNLQQSPVWGFAQVISLEMPHINFRCIDLDNNDADNTDIDLLVQKIRNPSVENRIALRQGVSYVSRLIPSAFVDKSLDVNVLESSNDDGESDNTAAQDGSYLVTGAFGALGKQVIRRLVNGGVKNIVLMGRRGAEGNETFITELEEQGIKTHVATADVGVYDDVSRVLHEVSSTMPPLTGIVHAAGILDDGIITQQTPDRFERIMTPKVLGAWNLHDLSLSLPIKSFVCFSSVASLLGSPGQSNYAAGNAFMDAIMQHRHVMGLPGLAVNWGPWEEDGMATDLLQRLEVKGFKSIPTEHGLDIFEQLLSEKSISQIGVSPVDWAKYFSAFPNNNVPFFENFSQSVESSAAASQDDGVSFRLQLAEALETERRDMLLVHVTDIVSSVFGFDGNNSADHNASLFDIGLDSLMALEIKNRLASSLELTLPTTLLFEHASISDLTLFLADELQLASPDAAAGSTEENGIDSALQEELDSLDSDELAALLAETLSD